MNFEESELLLNEVNKIYNKIPIKEKTFMEISGYPYYENVCSNILAFYLNPKEEHKLGSVFINSLIKVVKNKGQKIYKDIDLSHLNIYREYTTLKGNRIDIVIQNEEIVITDLLTAEMSRKLSDEVIEQAILTSKSDNVDYIPSDITLSTADMFLATAIGREMILRRLLLHKVFDRYDYILIDCLPSLGVLVVNALVAADGVLIPVQTQKFALNGIVQFEEIMTLAKELNPTLTLYGVIETMNDNTRMAKAVDEALTERYGNLVFNSRISKSVMASNSTAEQRAMTINTKLGSQYADLTNEFIGRCK